MHRTLAAVLFGISTMFVSFSSFGAHPKIFKDEAEAYASPSWTCDYSGQLPGYGYWGFYTIPLRGSLGSAMDVEGCLGAAQAKVVEMSAAWLAEMAKINAVYGFGPGSCSAPVRQQKCYKEQKIQILDPVTGMSIGVYPYNCDGQYVSTCVLHVDYPYATGHQHGMLSSNAGHPPGSYYWGGIYILANGKCPVDDLNYTPADPCSASLENSKGTPGPSCPLPPLTSIPVMTDPAGEQCFREKMGLLGIPYARPTASYRTRDYQKHLMDVWDKNIRHKNVTDPAKRALCAERRAKVEKEMTDHGLTDEPYGDSHSDGKAFDVANDTVKQLDSTLNQMGSDIFRWLLAPPPRTCNLNWGGDFKGKKDPVHFQMY